ncbi:MAG: dockerin type I domain-containing protein [Candidatus Bathyarchaeia archaeon]
MLLMAVSGNTRALGQGYSGNITVTAENLGGYTETFNITAYANTTIIASESVTLPAGNSTTVTFVWNSTGFAYGNYTISAYALPVLGETNTANNNFTGGVVTVTFPGDVNGDGTVDIYDAILLSGAFGSSPGSPKWNPNADLNNDGIVDIYDAIILAGNYARTA